MCSPRNADSPLLPSQGLHLLNNITIQHTSFPHTILQPLSPASSFFPPSSDTTPWSFQIPLSLLWMSLALQYSTLLLPTPSSRSHQQCFAKALASQYKLSSAGNPIQIKQYNFEVSKSVRYGSPLLNMLDVVQQRAQEMLANNVWTVLGRLACA